MFADLRNSSILGQEYKSVMQDVFGTHIGLLPVGGSTDFGNVSGSPEGRATGGEAGAEREERVD